MKTLVLVLLVYCGSMFAQEPIRFRGAYVGESLSDFVDCSSHKPKVIKEGYKIYGKLCEGKPGAISRIKNRAVLSVALDGESFGFNESRLGSITIFVPDADWEQVRDDLTAKMGAPLKEVPQVYQNGFGAHWEYGQGFWQTDDLVAFAKVNVASLGGVAVNRPFSSVPQTEGIEIRIMGPEMAKRAKFLPSSGNTLD
jgi:hypothetical protein